MRRPALKLPFLGVVLRNCNLTKTIGERVRLKPVLPLEIEFHSRFRIGYICLYVKDRLLVT